MEALLSRALLLDATLKPEPHCEELAGVPGAFIVRCALSRSEAAALGAVVLAAHAAASHGDVRRRDSQHHVPVATSQASLAPLCARLRASLPSRAGGSSAVLAPAGCELSSFLRAYAYEKGEESKMHLDRSFRDHSEGGGLLRSFSAYSLLIYCNDGFEGGETKFFQASPDVMLSCRGATPLCDRSSLTVAAAVTPRAGDVLIFPHGSHPGSYPSPLHEGSMVTSGTKLLLRTDVMFEPRAKSTTDAAPSPAPVPIQVDDPALDEFEAQLGSALQQLSPLHAHLARGSVKRVGERGGPDLESTVAAKVFWAAAGEARARGESRRSDGCVVLQSSYGIERLLTLPQLGALLCDTMAPCGPLSQLSGVRVAEGAGGTIHSTTRARRDAMASAGRVACDRCGRYVHARTGGLEWHLKNAHGLVIHSEAAAAAATAATALIPFSCRERVGDAAAVVALTPADLENAQRSPAEAAAMVAEGRVRALEPGLAACRSGDLATLKQLVEQDGWCPRTACDENGSGPLLWAAGGGHLDVCVYLVDSCGLDPSAPADARLARRGYSGRTALHWAARNGHVPVLRWLIDTCGLDCDVLTCDGTTALCWAAWRGQLEALTFLMDEGGSDPHASNKYGCSPAHWAAQGGCLAVCDSLRRHGVSFDSLNAQGQGCLHKAAQRGHAEVCDWLLSEVGLLEPGRENGRLHCTGNACEGARPSELARCGGHEALAARLACAEEDWLVAAATKEP
jgi:Ankyrin repeats (3 copies)/2OG-Fe(II) oxygenase superfamily